MNSQRTGIALTSIALMSVALAGCTLEGVGAATGTVVFCVQDDPIVNVSGVFVNFGNMQINTLTSGNNTINDNDQGGEANGTTSTANTTTGNATSNATANTTSAAPTTSPTAAETATTMQETTGAPNMTGGGAAQISATDVECSRVAGRTNFDFNVQGQRNLTTGDGENPGRGDENRGRSDAPCDRDQGFGNDWKCEEGRASKEVEVEAGEVNVMEFQDDRAAFVARADVPPMTINDVCIRIDDVRVTMNDSQEREVRIDVDQVCVEGPIEIREGQQTLVVAKLDLEQAMREEGDVIVFNPVIHLKVSTPVTQTIEIRETVTVSETDSTETGNQTTATTMTTGSTTATFGTNETASPTTGATNATTGP